MEKFVSWFHTMNSPVYLATPVTAFIVKEKLHFHCLLMRLICRLPCLSLCCNCSPELQHVLHNSAYSHTEHTWDSLPGGTSIVLYLLTLSGCVSGFQFIVTVANNMAFEINEYTQYIYIGIQTNIHMGIHIYIYIYETKQLQ